MVVLYNVQCIHGIINCDVDCRYMDVLSTCAVKRVERERESTCTKKGAHMYFIYIYLHDII